MDVWFPFHLRNDRTQDNGPCPKSMLAGVHLQVNGRKVGGAIGVVLLAHVLACRGVVGTSFQASNGAHEKFTQLNNIANTQRHLNAPSTEHICAYYY